MNEILNYTIEGIAVKDFLILGSITTFFASIFVYIVFTFEKLMNLNKKK